MMITVAPGPVNNACCGRNLGDTKGDNRNKKERKITQVKMKNFPMSLATLPGNRTEAAEMRAY